MRDEGEGRNNSHPDPRLLLPLTRSLYAPDPKISSLYLLENDIDVESRERDSCVHGCDILR
jgi:hypothetical protein